MPTTIETAKDTREHLLALATRHRPVDQTERDHQMAIIDWLASAKSPFDRTAYHPGHATGSCMVLSTQKRAALIFHKNLQLWVQPGGHAQASETYSADVAAREASEELGITVENDNLELFDLDVHRISPFENVPAHQHFDFRHLAVIEAVELEPATDAAEARWLTRSEMASLGLDIGMRRMADKAVARGLLIP